MKTQHTPGPWKFNAESIGLMPLWADCENSAGREVRQVVATVGATYNHLDVTLYGEQNKREVADAYLIAAAPELLEALVADSTHIHTFLECGEDHHGCPVTAFKRSAIAKAEGQ